MSEKFNGIHFDYTGVGPEGFCFGIAQDSPNELLAQRISKMFDAGKSFRLKVVDVEELKP